MNRTEVTHWLLNLQTDVEFAIERIRQTELHNDEEDVDEILIDELPKMISDMDYDISRAKENMV